MIVPRPVATGSIVPLLSDLHGIHSPSKRISYSNHLSSTYMQKIRVRTKPNGYVVQVGAGLLRRAGREVRRGFVSAASPGFASLVAHPSPPSWWTVGERILE